jgi:hypothetical protein
MKSISKPNKYNPHIVPYQSKETEHVGCFSK